MSLSWHCAFRESEEDASCHVSEEDAVTGLRNQSEQPSIAMSLKPWICFLGASEGDQQGAAMAASRMLLKLQEFCSQLLKQLACALAMRT